MNDFVCAILTVYENCDMDYLNDVGNTTLLDDLLWPLMRCMA